MFALLIAIGVLFLAVVVSAVVDPWPARAHDADDGVPTMDAIVLSA